MEQTLTVTLLLCGGIIVLAIALRHGAAKLGFPVLVGYLALGLLIRMAHARWGFLSDEGADIFAFLAEMGVIILLFRVGLESDLSALLERLPQASLIWVSDVLISGGLGYWAAHILLGWPLIPSLFVAVSLTATSVGVTVALWRENHLIDTSQGALMLDMAELDDLSGVVLMALLTTLVPVLREPVEGNVFLLTGGVLGVLILKLMVFGTSCFLFARYLERPITSFFQKLHKGEAAMLMVLGLSIVVAALAGLLGFSVAIGAFFAGLIFSRDPTKVKLDLSFESLHDLFVPFFFVGIGLQLDPKAFVAVAGPATLLLAVAVAGKFIGTSLPALPILGLTGATLIGVSMVPRAEIALIIMQRGLNMGSWAVPPPVFTDMIVVSAITVSTVPFILRPFLKRWAQTLKAT